MEILAENRHLPELSDPRGVRAASLYLAVSLFVFGRPLAGHFRDSFIGTGPSPVGLMMFMTWWPYALMHRLNPFYSDFMWAPVGINMTWVTSLPLPALVMWPIAAAFGPIAAYNIISLLSPPLAAWAAFLLCRHLSRSWWPSLLGGYLFGFSAYMLSEEISGDRHLTLAFPVPLAILTAVRAITEPKDPAIGRLILSFAALFVVEFLISTEIFATMALFGASALFVGWLFAPPQTAQRIVTVIIAIAWASLLAVVILSPYIYWLFALGVPPGEVWQGATDLFSGDPVRFAIPAIDNAIGSLAPFRNLAERFFTGGMETNSWYIGVPMLAILAAYGWRQWRSRLGGTLLILFVFVSLSALGRRPYVFGFRPYSLVGEIIYSLPLLNKALPSRFMMYSFLILAVIVSLWFATNRLGSAANAVLAAVVIGAALPNPLYPWSQPARSPAFFSDGTYREYLNPGENVLILPFGHRGQSDLWLAESGMYFRLVGGWVGPYPAEFLGWPVLLAFTDSAYLPDANTQLGAFLAHFKVAAAVVADSDPEAAVWRECFANFSSANTHIGGVTVFRIRSTSLDPYRNATKLQMRQQAAISAVDSLVVAAGNWLLSGGSLAQLTPPAALQRGFLKESWCLGPKIPFLANRNYKPLDEAADIHSHSFCGTGLGMTPDGRLMVGLFGSYADLKPAIDRYRAAAQHIYFPFPRDLLSPGAPAPAADKWALMVMEFDPDRVRTIATNSKQAKP
ncbi:MAG TPA: hypothetical protein VMU16_02290 [Candidatus Binataceae bacterium]|nr:hypothetical protein [Candidatus Binataceae bacterium]